MKGPGAAFRVPCRRPCLVESTRFPHHHERGSMADLPPIPPMPKFLTAFITATVCVVIAVVVLILVINAA